MDNFHRKLVGLFKHYAYWLILRNFINMLRILNSVTFMDNSGPQGIRSNDGEILSALCRFLGVFGFTIIVCELYVATYSVNNSLKTMVYRH